MTTAPEPGFIPQWDMADRMRKTLRMADQSVQEVAEYLGVSRNTVSSWINGRVIPDLTTQRLWAMRFGVPLEWLQTGIAPTDSGGPDVFRMGNTTDPKRGFGSVTLLARAS